METEEMRTNPEDIQSSSTNPQTAEQIIAALQAELAAEKAQRVAAEAQVKTLQAQLKSPQPRADKDQVAQPGIAMNEDTLRALLGDFGIVQFKTHDFLYTFPTDDNALHAGAGLKSIGFIDAAHRSATQHYQLIPSFRNLAEFNEAVTDFHNKQTLLLEVMQFAQKIQNSMFRSSDVAYHNALDYYNSVKEAARHKNEETAQTEFKILAPYFKRSKHPKPGDEPTETQIERDVRSLLHGTKEGELTIRNENSRTVGGKREIKDDAHKESATIHTVIGTEKKD